MAKIETKNKQLTLRLEESKFNKFKAWCHWEMKPMSEVLITFIDATLAKGDNDPRKKK